MLPRVHGSCVFTRGETQALVTVTLGTADDQQKIEMVDGETWKRFMLHYNFPPFSVGEVKPMRGPGRREIGHGALAERALAPMMPTEAEFAYTVRVVSDILESNGSSSMASVCGGSMAMMDAGVPIKAAVAGVAMGLIMDEATGKYAVLSDIAGAEDHYGDMDFKVTGTASGITALQMDIKVTGISSRSHARGADPGEGRPHAHPRHHERGAVGDRATKHVGLRAAHHHHQDPGRQDPRRHRPRRQDDPQHHREDRRQDRRRGQRPGQRGVGGRSRGRQGHRHDPGADRRPPKLDKTYLGKVQRITDFGAFIEIMPGTDGLLHVSEIAHYRVKDVRDELKEGQQVLVKVINIDPTGKIRLSRKALITPEEGGAPPAGSGGDESGRGSARGRPSASRPRPAPRSRSALVGQDPSNVRERPGTSSSRLSLYGANRTIAHARTASSSSPSSRRSSPPRKSKRRTGASSPSSRKTTSSRRTSSRCRKTTWSRSR